MSDVWDLTDESSLEEQNKVLLGRYGMPKTSSLPGWRLYFLDGEMPKERLVEFTADKLPLCDKIWFDTRCVTSCRASQILNGLCKNMVEEEWNSPEPRRRMAAFGSALTQTEC